MFFNMKSAVRLTILLLAVVAVALVARTAPAAEPVPGKVRVKFTVDAARGLSPDNFRGRGQSATRIPDFDALARDLGVSEIRSRTHPVRNARLDGQLGISRWYTLTIPQNADIDATLERLRNNPNVEYAVPVYPAETFAVPNDTYYARNWGLNNTGQFLTGTSGQCAPAPAHACGTAVGTVGFDGGLETAWDAPQGYGDPGVVIAIIDPSGVDVDHPDLNYVPGYDFTHDDDNPDAGGDPHGTQCAGIAAAVADNGLGVTGVAGGCSVMPIMASGTDKTADALVYAADNGADVVSMSLGFTVTTQKDLEDALEYAYLSDVVMFGATGNTLRYELNLPASHHAVIGVGAASPCGSRKRGSADPNGATCDNEGWWDSNYGSAVQDAPGAVDILAPSILPSTNIVGNGDTSDGGSADYSWTFNGTSCATPFAAGVAALVRSRWPGWTADQIRERMVSTAIDVVDVEAAAGWDLYTGYGLVNAAGALAGVTTRTVGAGYATIQAAIDASNDFDTVNVPAGTYPEVIDFHGRQILVRATSGPASTTIDGTGLGDAVVTMNSGETRASILRGFTITGGTGRVLGGGSVRGGGLYMFASAATIDQCVFDGNSAGNYGGAIYMEQTNALIRNCFVGAPGGTGNTSSERGGGVFILDPSATGDENLFHDTVFLGNTSTGNGGALLNQNGLVRIIDGQFSGNAAGGDGGAIHNHGAGVLNALSCTFVNNQAAGGGSVNCVGTSKAYFWQCDFTGNHAMGGDGGAIRANGDSLVVYSSRFFNNAASSRGGAIWSAVPTVLLHGTIAGNEAQGGGANDGGGGVYVTGVANVENTIVWGNTVANGDGTELAQIKNYGGTLNLVSTCIQGLSTLTGTDLTGANPLFVNPGAGDVHLQAGSPVRDIATAAAATLKANFDLDGASRDFGCGADLGAYEYHATGTIHVPSDVSTIQCALEEAVDGDSVIVAPGTYNERLSFLGKEVVLISSGGPGVTILDGTGLALSLVMMGETVNAELAGFTLANAAAAGLDGGALYLQGGSATVSNCWFVGNTAQRGGAVALINSRVLMGDCRFEDNAATGANGGGAIFFEGVPASGTTTSTLTNIEFSGNTATNGGAITATSADVELIACSFTNNTADTGGAVQVTSGATCVVRACDFEGNQALKNSGGALRFWSADGTVVSSRFFDNTANGDDSGDQGGGAVRVEANSDVTLAYCTMVQNHTGANTTAFGGGIDADGAGTTLTVLDCILWANTSPDAPDTEGSQIRSAAGTTTVLYNIIQGLSAFAGNSNMAADPKFVDPAGGDLHVFYNSPAIDTGNNAWNTFGVDKDLDGNPRVNNGISDRGAYEHTIVTAIGDEPARPVKTALHPATPNPFNPQTTISFDVARAGPVTLRVYNVRGQLVTTLWNDYASRGSHRIGWDGMSDTGTAVASGVYFVRMTATGFGATQKIVVLK